MIDDEQHEGRRPSAGGRNLDNSTKIDLSYTNILLLIILPKSKRFSKNVEGC
jgi:hypothetical protein